ATLLHQTRSVPCPTASFLTCVSQPAFEPLALSLGRAVGAFSCTGLAAVAIGTCAKDWSDETLLPGPKTRHEWKDRGRQRQRESWMFARHKSRLLPRHCSRGKRSCQTNYSPRV